jgi:hypothetical protein
MTRTELSQTTRDARTAPMPRWIVWCAYGAFVSALPTVLWRIPLGAGFTLGTPAAWREVQEIPGNGTWYVLGLSAFQFMAAACCLALSIDVRRLTPGWAPVWLRQRAGTIGGTIGLAGTVILAVIVVMSIVAWDRVDPFAGVPYGGWGWLCLCCYLAAALWPILLAAASIGYLARRGRP